MTQLQEEVTTGITTDLKLILWNDDVTPMEQVLFTIILVMGYDNIRAEQLMQLAHNKGKACLKEGGNLDELLWCKEAFGRVGITVTLE